MRRVNKKKKKKKKKQHKKQKTKAEKMAEKKARAKAAKKEKQNGVGEVCTRLINVKLFISWGETNKQTNRRPVSQLALTV